MSALRDEWMRDMLAKTAHMSDQDKVNAWNHARAVMNKTLKVITKKGN